MKDKITVATYMRVGNKEQLDTTGQEHKIPTPKELKAEGYDVITLPKKKAWLFMRTSKNTPYEEQVARLSIIRQNAINEGYDIVGETVVVGNSKQAKIELKHLLEHYLADKKAETVYMRGLRDMSFKFGEITEMYDMIKSAGLEVKTADGSIQALEGETEHGMKWRDIFTGMVNGIMDEPSEDGQDEGEAPTMTMGGGMQ